MKDTKEKNHKKLIDTKHEYVHLVGKIKTALYRYKEKMELIWNRKYDKKNQY